MTLDFDQFVPTKGKTLTLCFAPNTFFFILVKLSTIINNVKCFAEKYCLFLSGMAAAPKMEITAPSVKLNISYQGVRTFQAWVGPKVLDFSAHLILFNEINYVFEVFIVIVIFILSYVIYLICKAIVFLPTISHPTSSQASKLR